MTPFRFYTRLSLRLIGHEKAKNAGELMDGLKSVAESSIYYHTHRFLQRHQFLVPEPANDFAYWASAFLGHAPLGRALEAVDTLRFASLEDLRAALIRAVEPFAADKHEAAEGQHFQFLSARRWSIPTPHTAETFREMAEGLRRVTVGSLYLHVFEARLRLPPGENDFSVWLAREKGADDLARKCRAVSLTHKTLEDIRRELIRLFENAEDVRATA
jgi:hypothetical protein